IPALSRTAAMNIQIGTPRRRRPATWFAVAVLGVDAAGAGGASGVGLVVGVGSLLGITHTPSAITPDPRSLASPRPVPRAAMAMHALHRLAAGQPRPLHQLVHELVE